MLSRRDALLGAGGATAAQFIPAGATALDYPTRPVRVVNPTAAGGTSDIIARLVGQSLQDRLGQPFIIDDRPGAGSNIANEAVFRAPADGYTILAISKGSVLVNLLYENLAFDFMRDFTPLCPAAVAPLVMLAHPSVPARTLDEFIAFAKANPGKINYASAGVGSDPHLAGELFKMMAGIEMTHVAYRGGAIAMTDLLAGGVHLMFSNLPVADYIKAGKLRGLAVTTARRSKAYPDIPAVAESVPGFENGVWIGFVMRAGTPPDIVEKLNREIKASLAEPKVLESLAVLNSTPLPMTPPEMSKFFQGEIDRWGKVIKAANIKPE